VTESEVKAEMRLYILEVFLANILAINCCAAEPSDPKGAFAKAKEQMIGAAQTQSFPGLADAALSDLYAAELESAVTRIASMVDEQIDLLVKARRKMMGR
jgi:hypothetical protein